MNSADTSVKEVFPNLPPVAVNQETENKIDTILKNSAARREIEVTLPTVKEERKCKEEDDRLDEQHSINGPLAIKIVAEIWDTENDCLKKGYRFFIQINLNEPNKTPKFKPRKEEIAEFLHTFFHTVSFNNEIYVYEDSQGIYVSGKNTINAAIYELCRICGHEEFIQMLQTFVIPFIIGRNVYSKYPFDQKPHCIPFINGTLKFKDDKWESFEPKSYTDLVTWRFPFSYNKDAPTDLIKKVFTDWVDEDNYEILIQIPAQALLQRSLSSPFKMSYLLVGEHDAGKSCYIDLNQMFFGEDRCSEVPLQLIGAQFKNGEMEGKILNIYDDLSDKEFANLGAFKKLTGRFQHNIERKGADGYEGLIRCVHIFSANKPPALNIVDDDAFYSRFTPVTFPHEFPRDPTWKDRTFTSEFLSGFANLVLESYISLLKNGLPERHTIDEVKEFWLRESMPEYAFITDKLERGVGYTIPIQECYELYKEWMAVHQYPVSKVKDIAWFGRAMNKSQLIKSGQERYKTQFGTTTVDVYKGVRKKVVKEKESYV